MKLKYGMISVMLLSGAAYASDGIKLGGYADARYNWANTTPNTNNFGVAEGALYLGKTMGMGEVMVDLPFAGGGATNTFTFATGMAQAWVGWKYDNGFSWKMGQFDGIYGFEANDSADRFFSVAGLLKAGHPTTAGLLKAGHPTTHTGLKVAYAMSDSMNFHFLVANPANSGTMTGGNPDFGVRLDTKMDAYTASLGALFSKAVGAADGTMAFDLIVGTKMDALSFNLEGDFSKTGDASAMGFMALVTYGFSEMTKFGARLDWTKDAADAKMLGLAVGPSFEMNKDLTVKLEYNMLKPDGADSQSAIVLAAVHRF